MQEDPNILKTLDSLSCVSSLVIERALHKENTNQKKQTDSGKNELMIRFLTSKEQYRMNIEDFELPDEWTMYKHHNTIIENNIDLTGLIEAEFISCERRI